MALMRQSNRKENDMTRATEKRNDRMHQMFEDARPGGKCASCGHFPCTPEKAERDHPARKDVFNMETKYTPGPWVVHNDRKGKWDGIDVKESATQLSIATVHDLTNDEAANARLIAAAPDMLEALRDLAGTYEALDTLAGMTAESWKSNQQAPVLNRARAIINRIEKGE